MKERERKEREKRKREKRERKREKLFQKGHLPKQKPCFHPTKKNSLIKGSKKELCEGIESRERERERKKERKRERERKKEREKNS